MGRAHARIQRGPALQGDHLAYHLCRAAPHDLRVLRSRPAAGCGTHCPRRHLSGQRVQGGAQHEARGAARCRQSRQLATGRTLGRRTVEHSQAGDRGAPAEEDRAQHVPHLRVRRWALERRKGGDARGAWPRVGVEGGQRGGARCRHDRRSAAGRGGGVPRAQSRGVGDHRRGLLQQGHHPGRDQGRRCGLVDASAPCRSRALHLVPAQRGSAARLR